MTLIDTAPDRASLETRIAGRTELVLKSSEFRKGREESWRELEGLVGRVERRGVRGLSLDELLRLPILYRAALSSLSVARTIALDRNLLLYLESLALRSFLAVYGPRASPLEGLRAFFGRELPAAVRSARWHILVATLCLLVGTVAGFMLTVQDEAWFSSFVPSGLSGGRGPTSTRADLLNKEINRILARPEVKDAWEKQGAVPLLLTPDEFGAHVQSEIEKWAKIIKANAITAE